MRRFFHGTDLAFNELEEQARTAAYVNFPEAELPSGCSPARARIGLKVDPISGVTSLFIERGIRYYGAAEKIRHWTQDGVIRFGCFSDFRIWIQTELSQQFEDPVTETPSDAHASDQPAPGALQAGASLANVFSPGASRGPNPEARILLEVIVREIGRYYGVDVHRIEPALLADLLEQLRLHADARALQRSLDEVLGGPFAFASAKGQSEIEVLRGPPIACRPIPSNHE